MILQLLDETEAFLVSAGSTKEDIDEVRSLLERPPEQTSVAVLGPQNAGKSTLIAVLTGSDQALEDVAPTIATSTSSAYRYERAGTRFLLWDTPGLGTEFAEHDEEARDRITKADAVLVAMSSDLVSDDGKTQLAEVLHAGRKRGAVLPAVTKADREPLDNRAGTEQSFRLAVPGFDGPIHWVAARDVLDARKDGEEDPPSAGIDELRLALEKLAVGEARRRIALTAAIRLVGMLEKAETQLAAGEPEAQRAHLFQRRIGRMLVRAERSMDSSIQSIERQSRLAAFRAAAVISAAIDERLAMEELQLVIEGAQHAFDEELVVLDEKMAEAVSQELERVSAELDRLEQGALAEHLRDVAASLDARAPTTEAAYSVRDMETARRVLEFAGRAAKMVNKIKIRKVPAGVVIGVLVDIANVVVDTQEAKAIEDAKSGIRDELVSAAEDNAERVRAWFDEAKSETTGQALSRCATIEDELFQGLTGLRSDLERLVGRRRALDDHISAEMRAGYETS